MYANYFLLFLQQKFLLIYQKTNPAPSSVLSMWRWEQASTFPTGNEVWISRLRSGSHLKISSVEQICSKKLIFIFCMISPDFLLLIICFCWCNCGCKLLLCQLEMESEYHSWGLAPIWKSYQWSKYVQGN